MHKNFDFFKTNMPKSRKADYYLGCLDSSVFMDFNKNEHHQIYLRRISYDGFGCYNLDYNKNCVLDKENSKLFREELKAVQFDELIENQYIITDLVLKLIELNKSHLDNEPLEKYGFL